MPQPYPQPRDILDWVNAASSLGPAIAADGKPAVRQRIKDRTGL